LNTCIVSVASFVCLSFASGTSVADEVILANGIPGEGNVMLIGDKKQWDTFVGAEPVSSASGYLSVERNAEDQAISAAWNGEGEAQFFVARESPKDYSEHVAQDSALVILLRVDKPPRKKVTMRMGCGYPCASNADITKLLRALPPGEWLRVSFDLKCFAEGGLNINSVDTPVLITTRGEMSLTIADIGMVAGLGPEATIRCR
jgi:beta-glucosidase